MTTRGSDVTAAIANSRRVPVKKAIIAASVGNIVEWFDFGLYGFFSTALAKEFFPAQAGMSGLLSVFAVFGSAFLIRPLGGAFFGILGDRFGRRRVLPAVILLMSLSTVLVGVLPGYRVLGPAAPVDLVLLRLVQGFSAGGEIGGATTFVGEYARSDRRGYCIAYITGSAFFGVALAGGVAFVINAGMSQDSVFSWGYRAAFIGVGLLGAVGLYIRLRLDETPAFRDISSVARSRPSPLRTILRNWRRLAQIVGVTCIHHMATYIVVVFMAPYIGGVLTPTLGLLSTMAAGAVAAVLVVPFGRLSDRIGRKPMMLAGSAGIAVFSYPILLLITARVPALVYLGEFLLAAMLAWVAAPAIALMTELVRTDIRYSGSSIGYNISSAAFGGTAPFLGVLITSWTGNQASVAFLLIGAGVLAFLTGLTVAETRGRAVDSLGTDPVPQQGSREVVVDGR